MTRQGTSLDRLKHVIWKCPAIDNHAHNLLLPGHIDDYPFEILATEAQGPALKDTFKTLPHLRAQRQLKELYDCPEDADWQSILDKRTEWLKEGTEGFMRKCLEGIHCLLLDDGFGSSDRVYNYDGHDRLTPGRTKRIVRIEAVAEAIMTRILSRVTEEDLRVDDFLTDAFTRFSDSFEREIADALEDTDVVGFKTVICYRSGLNVEPDFSESLLKITSSFEHYVSRCLRKRKYRIERKGMNDFLVLRTLEMLSEPGLSIPPKPLQFHCGLGDADISLRYSNPAYLQPLIEQYPTVPFVLLHSAYPYTREAGYLATMYKHVYLDLGEVFPMLSRDGQVSIIRQSLELTPVNKLLFSTDARYFAENYWLSNKQFREALEEVLVEYVQKRDITESEAISMCKDILFNNSNILYDLRYPLEFQEIPEKPSLKAIGWSSGPVVPIYDTKAVETFKEQYPTLSFVYVQWLDYMGTIRTRILPFAEFNRLVNNKERIGISRGNIGTLQNDAITPVVNTCGQIYVEPDLASLRVSHQKDPLPSATVLAFWRDEDGNPIKECPRGSLQLLLDELSSVHSTTLLIGFEIEVTFLKRGGMEDAEDTYVPLTKNHAWGTLSPEQWQHVPFLAEIVTNLAHMGIHVQQFHPESGQGQYEFVLPPMPPLTAIDTLVQARQAIAQIAATHNLRATLHPQPFSGIGTAAHAHISIIPEREEMAFWVAGVLAHLEAICAFSLPEAVSYSRVIDNSWTGGTWVSWGTQNRECPLRRVSPGHWEVRCLDGTANMYLAIAAVLGAGMLGLKEAKGVVADELAAKDCPYNPSKMNPEQRRQYGIEHRLPKTIHESLTFLEKDIPLREVLAEGLVSDYLIMKKAEQKMLEDMPEEKRRSWLIERY